MSFFFQLNMLLKTASSFGIATKSRHVSEVKDIHQNGGRMLYFKNLFVGCS